MTLASRHRLHANSLDRFIGIDSLSKTVFAVARDARRMENQRYCSLLNQQEI
jgi:hypothetical protein